MFKCVRTAEGVRLYRTIYSPGEEACCLWARPILMVATLPVSFILQP